MRLLNFVYWLQSNMRAQTSFGKMASATHEQVFGGALLALRLALGWQFLASGFDKLTSDWSAEMYLNASAGPFAEWFQSLAGNGFVDGLNAWGQLLIGIALILGLMVRPASIAGALMMAMYYLAGFVENTSHGLIEDHVIYALVFVLFASGGAGHIFGLNSIVLSNIRRQNSVYRFLFG